MSFNVYSSEYTKELHIILQTTTTLFHNPYSYLKEVEFHKREYDLEKIKTIFRAFLGNKVRGLRIAGDSIFIRVSVFQQLLRRGLLKHPTARGIYSTYIPGNNIPENNYENFVIEPCEHEKEIEDLKEQIRYLRIELDVVKKNSEYKDRINRTLKQKLEIARLGLYPNVTVRQKFKRNMEQMPPSPLGRRSQSWDL